MRPGKRERALHRVVMELKRAQTIRASMVPHLPGRARGSLDAAFKGHTVIASKPQWDYLPKRVNGVARLSLVRKPDNGVGEDVLGDVPSGPIPTPAYLDKKKRKKRFANA